MAFFTPRNLAFAIGAGIVGGVLVGALANAQPDGFFSTLVQNSQIFGKIFLAALRMIVVPLVLFSVVSGVASLQGSASIGSRFARTLIYFVATSFLAVLIGIILTNIIRPGAGMNSAALLAGLPEGAREEAQAAQASIAAKAPATFSEFLDQQIANVFMNPFKAMAEMNLVGLVAFALALGLALVYGGEKARPAIAFFAAMEAALMRLVSVVMWLAPLGIFALAARTVGAIGADIIRPLSWYFLTVSLALFLHGVGVYSVLVWTLARYSPIRFFKGAYEVIVFAFSTASSAATMPVTMRVAQEKLGVDEGSAGLVIPMGATVNMDGTALYEAVAAMFIAQLLGMELTLTSQILIFFTATLAAIGAAGIPQAGLVTMVIVFNAIGIPLEWMAVIIVVDRPLDHLRTCVNVLGDLVGAVYLSRTAGLLKDPA
jgi:Na+/H+-dicarboxylate symporter